MGRRDDPAAKQELEEYRAATEAARGGRAAAAAEVGAYIGRQVERLIVEGDVMGGREMCLMRLRALLEAEKSGDPEVVRSAVMELAGGCGAWVAQIDLQARRRSAA